MRGQQYASTRRHASSFLGAPLPEAATEAEGNNRMAMESAVKIGRETGIRMGKGSGTGEGSTPGAVQEMRGRERGLDAVQ